MQATLFDLGYIRGEWQKVTHNEYRHPRLPGLAIVNVGACSHFPYTIRGAAFLGTFRTLVDAKDRAEFLLDPPALLRLAGQCIEKAERIERRAADMPFQSVRARDLRAEAEWVLWAAGQMQAISAAGGFSIPNA